MATLSSRILAGGRGETIGQPKPYTQPPPSAPTAAPAAGKVSGPYDKFRASKPPDIPDEWWNQYIDAQNTTYQKVKASDPNWNEKHAQDEINRITPQAFEQAARTNGGASYAQASQTLGAENFPKQPLAQAQSAATRQSAINQITDLARETQAENRAFVDERLVPLLADQQIAARTARDADQQALSQLSGARTAANTRDAQNVQAARNTGSAYNYLASDAFNAYQGQQSGLNTQDQNTLSRYLGETDPLMTQLQARGSNPADIAAQQAALQQAAGIAGGALNYTAAQARSNAQDVARQQQSYDTLSGIGGGSLDYNAAQYAWNPADEQRQVDAFSDLSRTGKGALDWKSQAAQAYADAGDVANQRKALSDIQADVAGGQKDQRAIFDIMKSRTDVAPTAQEALLYELSRRTQAEHEKSSRDAVAERMASQGLRSGAAQLAATRGASQQNSENALLSNLAANAGAVQRAQAYTGMAGEQANAIRASQQNALGLQGSLSTALRNASFDEAYKRGLGADNASAANQATRLSGQQGAMAGANAIRQANDTVGLANTGWTNQARANNQATRLSGNVAAGTMATNMRNASDQMSMFNTGQTNQAYANNQQTQLAGAGLQASQSNAIRTANDAMSQFQDAFAQTEATRVGNLASQRANTGLATTNQVGTRNQQTYRDQQAMYDTNYARDMQPITMANGQTQTQYARDADVARMTGDVGERQFARTGTMIGSTGGVAGIRSGATTTGNQQLINALSMGIGNSIFEDDAKALGGGW